MTNLDLTVDRSEAGALVIVEGALDIDTVHEFSAVLEQLAGERHREVAVDLSELAFMDSTGLGVLAAARSRVAAGGGTLTLRSPTAQITRMLSVTGMDRLFDIR